MQRDDIDPYSTAIVEDLLQSQQEWKNINDIIRLTFKALTDVVKSQGESIRELEKQISTRASKNELHTGLSLKANINDISRTIAEIASNLDSKITYEDTQTVLKDYVLKADMQYVLSNKLDVDEVKTIIEKQSSGEFKTDIIQLKSKLDELQQHVSKKFTQVPTMKDYSALAQQIEIKANLQEMNEVLESKASKHQVQQAINKKISRQELDQTLQNYASLEDVQPIIQSLDQKASLDQIDKIASILEVKVDRTDFTILINSLQSKVEMNQHEQLREMIQDVNVQFDQKVQDIQMGQNELKGSLDTLSKQTLKKTDHQIDKITQQNNNIQADIDSLSAKLSKISQEIYQDQQRLKNELIEQKQFTSEQMQTTVLKSTHLTEKLTEELYNLSEHLKQIDDERREEQDDIRKTLQKTLNQKRDTQFKVDQISEQLEEMKSDAVSKQLQKQVQAVSKEVNELKAKILAYDDEQQIATQIEQQLQRKVNEIKRSTGSSTDQMKGVKQEIASILSKKLGGFEQQLSLMESNLKARVMYQDFEELKNIIQKLCIDQDERAYQKDLSKHIQLTKYTLDLIQKDMMMKANVQDMCTLLDNKPNIADINGALDAMHKDIQNKVASDELQNYLKNQSQVYESLCQENIVARFQWRSGDLQNHLVPWEYEVINTLPDNFIWEKNKTSILIVAPGVYHIAYAFFAKDKQTIAILINGESIHSQELKKKNNEYIGICLQEFIVLPNRARIQVSYSGQKGEGFLSLKRL